MIESPDNNLLSKNIYFKNLEDEKKYLFWNRPLVQEKLFASTLLAAFLYIVYAQLDRYFAPLELRDTMSMLHMYVMAPLLSFISLLGYLKKSYFLTTFLLVLTPLLATIVNLYIVTNIEAPLVYLTEVYLIVFWIFTISGLRLQQATISAILVYLTFTIAIYNSSLFDKEVFVMCLFWITSSFAFGFLNAMLLEKSNKIDFLNKLELERLATTDTLTGLYNRSKLGIILNNELERSDRFGHLFGFVILDIDLFKSVNDTYGHQIGDSVLVEISNIIKNHIRSTDTAFRWGGEEFVIIYLETDEEEVLSLSEKLRTDIENHLFQYVTNQTVSIGATVYKEGDDNISITQRADKALYQAKVSGRNRTKVL